MTTNKPMILILSLFLMLFTTSATLQTPADTLDPEPCATTNNTFQNGEKITYKIYYNLNFVWIPAGEVVFKVFDEGNQYHYQAIGTTYSSYEWFYTVRDEYNSWVDKNTLLPNYSERSVSEGDYHIFEKISFNQSARKMTVWRSKKKGEEETKTEHTVTDCVHDVLSSLYQLRNQDVSNRESGSVVPFRIFMDKEEYPLKMKYVGKEGKKKVYGMGKYKTMKFQPDVIAGNVFSEEAKMSVWVSDDQNRIPLLIETPVSVGSVKMVIKEYWGLKYDFTAKVN